MGDGGADHGPLFAVTTRSRLKGPWFFPPMLIATLRVRRQLRADPAVVRWSSMIAGPSEFWTITVWRSRHDMQEFMRSGAHDQIMWLFSRWLRSFWLMRWRPCANEIGDWRGLRLSAPTPSTEGQDGEVPSPNPGLEQALAHLPWLAAATGPDGRARYDHSPVARRRRAEVGQAGGVFVNLRVPLRTLPAAVVALRRLRDHAVTRGAQRTTVGMGRPGDLFLLAVFRKDDVDPFLAEPVLGELVDRWPDRTWCSSWEPENEFGHWDGLRVRRRRRGTTLTLPTSAGRLA